MTEIIAALAVLGAVGNVVLGVVLYHIVAVSKKDGCTAETAPESRERTAAGKVRIISPYIKQEKRGDRQ